MRHLPYFVLAIFLVACAGDRVSPPAYLDYSAKPKHIQICYKAADSLSSQLVVKRIPPLRILKLTFVDIDNVESSSSSGRIYPEVIASRLSQLGYAMVELKVRSNSIKIVPQKGEMILSYDQTLLANEYNASAALIGYYKRVPGKKLNMVYSRIINLNDNSILASDDFSIED